MNPKTKPELGRAGVGTPLEARPTVQPARLLIIKPGPDNWLDWVAWLNKHPIAATCGLREGIVSPQPDRDRRTIYLRRDGVVDAIARYHASGAHLKGLLAILKAHWRRPKKTYPASFDANLREET